MEIKIDSTYKGTRILFGDTAKNKRKAIDGMISVMESFGFQEMMIPVIQKSEIFTGKVGGENQNMMFQFVDAGGREICLAPEYTAVVQLIGSERFKYEKDVKLFYVGECFRGEKPQMGRYRQFTQFGVEILNPTKDYSDDLVKIAKKLIEVRTKNYELNLGVSRGLDYYKNGLGFEISCPELGAQKQVCGGGEYDGGVGFAIGVDRLILCG